jgi:aminopeptidase-like protein
MGLGSTNPKEEMKKIIEDLFKYDRKINNLLEPLDYINKIISLKYHFWREQEKAWTWNIPQGGIQIGEYVIEGETKDCIIIPIHLDHPKQANDNLSGVTVAIKLAQSIKNPRYTYKFLFLSETIGTMAYLSRFGTNYKYGIVIDSVGGDGDLVTTLTKHPSLLNEYVLGKTNSFFSDAHLWSGNDERALESVGIPSIQISRAPFLEYHTERDTPDRINEEQLESCLRYTLSIIDKIEKDFIPKPTYMGVPCLSANGLWKKEYESPHTFMKVEKVWQSLSDGLSIAHIANIHGLDFDFVYNFVMELKSKGLVKC